MPEVQPENKTLLTAQPKPDAEKSAEIDMNVLAQKVYALLKKDLQIETERLGRRTFR